VFPSPNPGLSDGTYIAMREAQSRHPPEEPDAAIIFAAVAELAGELRGAAV
jgi:hypothetical protein